MARRGRPPKARTVVNDPGVEKIGGTDIESPAVNTDIVAPNVFQDNSVSFWEGREDLYKKYDEMTYGAASVAEKTEDDVTPAEQVEEEENTVVPEPEKQEIPAASAEKEVEKEEEVKEEKLKEEIKTVPLSALQESRAKERELKRRIKELEEGRLVQSQVDIQGADDLVTKRELEEYRQEMKHTQAALIDIIKERQENKVKSNIEHTHAELEKEGIPFFKEFGQKIVTQRLTEMQNEDPELAAANDNPDGWKKIWKEEYQMIRKMFISEDMASKMQEKQERKQFAKLTSSPGIKSVKEETDFSKVTPQQQYHDYMKMRRERSI